jgi:hypothetical protein
LIQKGVLYFYSHPPPPPFFSSRLLILFYLMKMHGLLQPANDEGIGSRYFPLSTEFNEQFERNRKGNIDPDVYAKEVVTFIEKKVGNECWAGYSSSMVWWLETLNLQGLYEKTFVKQFGLDRKLDLE